MESRTHWGGGRIRVRINIRETTIKRERHMKKRTLKKGVISSNGEECVGKGGFWALQELGQGVKQKTGYKQRISDFLKSQTVQKCIRVWARRGEGD